MASSQIGLIESPEVAGKVSTVKEGFLCPICMDDLQSFHNLQKHFDSKHSSDDKAFLDQVRGVFSRARDKLFNKEYDESEKNQRYTSTHLPTQSYHELDMAFWEPQEIGFIKHRMDQFRCIRDARIDRAVVETNKIIIRLDKLLQMPETDQSKRKDYERSLVPWVQDEDVPFCPTCGDKFSIARRRHHCRLCGAIMCTKCSIFLSIREAGKIIERNKQVNQSFPARQDLPNLPEEEIDKINIRVCIACDDVLLRNQEKLNMDFSSSLLVKLHTKMVAAMEAAEKLCPEFQIMAESLNNGEEEYKLDVAMEKRLHLMQMFEAVDVLSKKIAVLYTEDEENPQLPGAQRLQNAIRKAACTYLQENMLILPALPSAPKLLVLQARRRAENEKRLRKQREEALRQREEQRRIQELERLKAERDMLGSRENTTLQVGYSAFDMDEDNIPVLNDRSTGMRDPGWSADAPLKNPMNSDGGGSWKNRSNSSDDSDDEFLGPLCEQMSYVENSMKQAKAAGMQSEANSLSRNLEELKLEYKRQKASRAFAGSSSFDENTSQFPRRQSCESGDEDVMMHQIKYISKCIEDARAAKKFDEVKILTENLDEIKKIYSQTSRN